MSRTTEDEVRVELARINAALAAGIINRDKVQEAAETSVFTDSHPGFCIACGLEHDGCEPDMRDGECEGCGASAVFGAQELMLSWL
jgi:hypothetical protein